MTAMKILDLFGIHVCKFYRQQAGQQQSSNQVYDGF